MPALRTCMTYKFFFYYFSFTILNEFTTTVYKGSSEYLLSFLVFLLMMKTNLKYQQKNSTKMKFKRNRKWENGQ